MRRPPLRCRKEIIGFRDAWRQFSVADGETDHMGVELSLDWTLARDWSVARAA